MTSPINKFLFRDGTGQAQRLPQQLNPDYVPVDERTLEDWIRFAQEYAKELVFFDANNKPASTWEGFLGDGSKAGNEAFIADIISYINNPGKFEKDHNKFEKF